jgi:hypothetical protein
MDLTFVVTVSIVITVITVVSVISVDDIEIVVIIDTFDLRSLPLTFTTNFFFQTSSTLPSSSIFASTVEALFTMVPIVSTPKV